jgi:hypothetical protein
LYATAGGELVSTDHERATPARPAERAPRPATPPLRRRGA